MNAAEDQKTIDLITVPLISTAVVIVCTILILVMTFGVSLPFIDALQESINLQFGGNYRNATSLIGLFLNASASVAIASVFVEHLQRRMPDDLVRGNSDVVWSFVFRCFLFMFGIFIWSVFLGELRLPGGDLRRSFNAYGFEADPDGTIAKQYSWLLYFAGYTIIGTITLFVRRANLLCATLLSLSALYYFGLSTFINEAADRSQFNSDAWKAADPHTNNKRITMIHSLLEQLREKRRDQVIQMLAEPGKRETARWNRERWFYYLGELNTSTGPRPVYLGIELYGDTVSQMRQNDKNEWKEIHGHP